MKRPRHTPGPLRRLVFREADHRCAWCEATHDLTVSHVESWPFLYRFSHQKFQGYVGACHARLGLRKAAIPALREAVDGMPEGKQRAILLTDLAIVVGGDEATELRIEARQIGEEHQSRRVLARI